VPNGTPIRALVVFTSVPAFAFIIVLSLLHL